MESDTNNEYDRNNNNNNDYSNNNNSNNNNNNINYNNNNNNNNNNRSITNNNSNKNTRKKTTKIKPEKIKIKHEIKDGHISLSRAFLCLFGCIFYIGVLAGVVVYFCKILAHLLGVGGSTVGATIVALGSEVSGRERVRERVIMIITIIMMIQE